MDMVERRLFDADGNLKKSATENDPGGKVINLWRS
jgi:hypothetical protein